MEFVFGLIGLLFGFGMLILIPYAVYGNWVDTKRELKRMFTYNDGIIGGLYVILGLFLALLIFVFLCACNNSFWHLDYLTTEGLWKK